MSNKPVMFRPEDHRSAHVVALLLANLLTTKFGGKENGRFWISHRTFLFIARRAVLTTGFLTEVQMETLELGIAFIPLANGFGVCPSFKIAGWRRLTKATVMETSESLDSGKLTTQSIVDTWIAANPQTPDDAEE